MELICKDALLKELGITNEDCEKCAWGDGYGYCTRGSDFTDACDAICTAPVIEERKTGKWCGLWSEPHDDKSIYGEKLIEGDTVYLLGVEGTVRQESGAWGWGSCNYVPWELLENKIPHNNKPSFCYCDNFISFWELKWNFDDGEDWDGVPFIRHNCGAKMEGEQP